MGFSVRLPVLKASMENSAQVAVNARMSFAMRQLDAFADKVLFFEFFFRLLKL